MKECIFIFILFIQAHCHPRLIISQHGYKHYLPRWYVRSRVLSPGSQSLPPTGSVSYEERSQLVGQKGATVWLTGLSASGKVSGHCPDRVILQLTTYI